VHLKTLEGLKLSPLAKLEAPQKQEVEAKEGLSIA